jgi:hypothetical protein
MCARASSKPSGTWVGLGRITLLVLPFLLAACGDSSSPANNASNSLSDRHHMGADRATVSDTGGPSEPAEIEVFAPESGDRVGTDGVGWFLDIAVGFEGNLVSTGFKGNQLTGPGVHNNAPPFPGNAGVGADDKFPGLVVLISTTSPTIGGACQNLANLFNLTGVTNRTEDETEIWDTWIIGAQLFGRHTPSTLYVAEVADLNQNGIHDDAPAVVPDVNHDGLCNETDLEALGLDSEVAVENFFIR